MIYGLSQLGKKETETQGSWPATSYGLYKLQTRLILVNKHRTSPIFTCAMPWKEQSSRCTGIKPMLTNMRSTVKSCCEAAVKGKAPGLAEACIQLPLPGSCLQQAAHDLEWPAHHSLETPQVNMAFGLCVPLLSLGAWTWSARDLNNDSILPAFCLKAKSRWDRTGPAVWEWSPPDTHKICRVSTALAPPSAETLQAWSPQQLLQQASLSDPRSLTYQWRQSPSRSQPENPAQSSPHPRKHWMWI